MILLFGCLLLQAINLSFLLFEEERPKVDLVHCLKVLFVSLSLVLILCSLDFIVMLHEVRVQINDLVNIGVLFVVVKEGGAPNNL